MATVGTLDIDVLIGQLTARGLKVIPVIAGATEEDADGDLFDGSLDAYLDTLALLNASIVRLSRDRFGPSLMMDDLDEEDSAIVEAAPSLRRYQKRVGEVCSARLSAITPVCTLDLVIEPDWVGEFWVAVEAAQETVRCREDRLADEEERQSAARSEHLLATLRGFEGDDACLALRTQSKIRAYVLDAAPELSELSSSALKEGVLRLSLKADLHAKARPRRAV
jgi:hypothetical protein